MRICVRTRAVVRDKCLVCDQRQSLGQVTAMPPILCASRQAPPLPWASVSQGPSLPSTLPRTHLPGVPSGRAFWGGDWLARAGTGTPPGVAGPSRAAKGETGSLAAPTGTGQSCPSSPFTQQRWGHGPRVNPGPGLTKSSSNGDRAAASPPHLSPSPACRSAQEARARGSPFHR